MKMVLDPRSCPRAPMRATGCSVAAGADRAPGAAGARRRRCRPSLDGAGSSPGGPMTGWQLLEPRAR